MPSTLPPHRSGKRKVYIRSFPILTRQEGRLAVLQRFLNPVFRPVRLSPHRRAFLGCQSPEAPKNAGDPAIFPAQVFYPDCLQIPGTGGGRNGLQRLVFEGPECVDW